MDKYRILSLDGGGTWSLLQVMALQKLYGPNANGHGVLRRFDLVAANGGGSIVLAGLAMNLTLQQLLKDIFLNEAKRKKIFGLTKPKYRLLGRQIPTKVRLEALRDVLGDYHNFPLGALYGTIRQAVGFSPELLFCAFDCDRRRPEFFRSNLGSRSASSTGTWDPSFAHVIHASVTSPKDFEALANIDGTRFCEGSPAGLYNPLLAAVTEARANRPDGLIIQALSIGTGTVERLPSATDREDAWPRIEKKREPAAFLDSIARSSLDDAPDTATYVAHVLLGQDLPSAEKPPPIATSSIVRLNPVVRFQWDQSKSGWALKQAIASNAAAGLALVNKAAIERPEISNVENLGKLWTTDAVDNQPIRSNRNFKCEIGHEKFSKAVDAWRTLVGEPALRDTPPQLAGAPPAAA
jgi:Patatin-like phospholipase